MVGPKFTKDERDDIEELLEMCYQALAPFGCPYFKYREGITDQFGSCNSGCYSEPSCVTDDDVLGYLVTLKACVADLIDIFESKEF